MDGNFRLIVCRWVCLQILWTEECERSLEEYENGAEDAVRKYLEVCCVRLDGLIKLVQGE